MRKAPKDVTIEDVDAWAETRVQHDHSFYSVRKEKTWFWRLLRDCGCTELTPLCILREKHYGLPIDQFPPGLKKEVLELLRWKRAEYSVGRPKGGRLREVSSKLLQQIICEVAGYAAHVREESEIGSLSQLVQQRTISSFVEWGINERKRKGQALQRILRSLLAAMKQHPSYASLDLSWFKPLIDSIPTEPNSELKKRKAAKYLEYKVLESILVKIHSQRPEAQKKGMKKVALFAMHELLMRWLITLPWRQRNIRECRIGGPSPNLFKAAIMPFSDIDKPEWVVQEEQQNSAAEFWQFSFIPDETKKANPVHALLPRQLIGPLEEYLREFRQYLVKDADPRTLFVNQEGNSLTLEQMTRLVSNLTLRHGGRRVTPHLFRDIVAYTWLKEHPSDYLTLSKMFWHSNVNEVIRTYGSRFNESSGVCAMESWLDKRQTKLR